VVPFRDLFGVAPDGTMVVSRCRRGGGS
jgi:hypothetical protein